jgi:hypothetical protein
MWVLLPVDRRLAIREAAVLEAEVVTRLGDPEDPSSRIHPVQPRLGFVGGSVSGQPGRLAPLTAALSELPAWNFGTLAAGMCTF